MLPNLKLLRSEKGISQQRLADAVDVSQPSINKYENHKIEPEIAVLCRIADYFNTSVDYLVGHTDIRQKFEPTAPYHLNDEESEFLTRFRHLSAQERACILTTMQLFLQ